MKIILFGYYGFRNLGDDLMLSVILDALSKKDFVETVSVVVRENYYAEFDGVKKITFFDGNSMLARSKRISLLFDSDAAIWGGGTCLYEPEAGDTAGMKNIYRNMRLLRLFGKPYFFLGVGIGKIASERGHRIIKSIIDGCAHINFRDGRSLEKASAIIEDGSGKFSLGGDLLFLMKENIKKAASGSRAGEFRVGFCGVRQYEGSQDAVNACAESLNRVIADMNARIIFFPFHQGSDNDNDFHRRICERLPVGTYEVIEYAAIKDALSTFKTLDFVVGMRLHSIILADIMGIPNLAINYSPKVRYYVDKSGVVPEERLVEVGEVFHPGRVESVLKSYAQRKDILSSFISKEAEDAKESVDMVFQLLPR